MLCFFKRLVRIFRPDTNRRFSAFYRSLLAFYPLDRSYVIPSTLLFVSLSVSLTSLLRMFRPTSAGTCISTLLSGLVSSVSVYLSYLSFIVPISSIRSLNYCPLLFHILFID